jgi:hypothetical protein
LWVARWDKGEVADVAYPRPTLLLLGDIDETDDVTGPLGCLLFGCVGLRSDGCSKLTNRWLDLNAGAFTKECGNLGGVFLRSDAFGRDEADPNLLEGWAPMLR